MSDIAAWLSSFTGPVYRSWIASCPLSWIMARSMVMSYPTRAIPSSSVR